MAARAPTRKRKFCDRYSSPNKHSWEVAGDPYPDEPANAAWDRGDGLDDTENMCRFGDMLANELVRLYAEGAMPAIVLTKLCFLAVNSGAKGGDLQRYAVDPDTKGDNASRHLQATLPLTEAATLCWVDVPVTRQARREVEWSCHGRIYLSMTCVEMFAPRRSLLDIFSLMPFLDQVESMPFAPPHECLAIEFANNPQLHDVLKNTTWPESFDTHPMRIVPGDPRPCFPVSLYIDGVRFTKSIGTQQDAIINVTVTNMASGRRHFLGGLQKSILCRCGCSGYDSIYVLMNFLRWSFDAAQKGMRPFVRWDKSEWPEDSVYRNQDLFPENMQARFLLTEIRADWAEFVGSFGFRSWRAINRPCPFCRCGSSGLSKQRSRYPRTPFVLFSSVQMETI